MLHASTHELYNCCFGHRHHPSLPLPLLQVLTALLVYGVTVTNGASTSASGGGRHGGGSGNDNRWSTSRSCWFSQNYFPDGTISDALYNQLCSDDFRDRVAKLLAGLELTIDEKVSSEVPGYLIPIGWVCAYAYAGAT